MNYRQNLWNKALGQDERIEWEFTLSSRYLNISLFLWTGISLVIIALGFLNIVFFFAGIAVFAISYFRFGFFLRWSNLFAFTNRRVLVHRGWLSTSMMSIDYSQITEIEARQGFTQRMLYGSGTLMINTAGSSDQEAVIENVQDPYILKQKLAELMKRDEHSR